MGRSEAGVESEGLISSVNSHTRFGVFSNTFFKEVGFPMETYRFHPFKQVAGVVVSAAANKVE